MSSEEKVAHPLDEATYRYKTSLSRIHVLNKTLSKKALTRVYNATMGFPLADKTPKFRDALENELFMLTLTALSAKDYILDFVITNQKQITELAKEERTEETYVK